MANVYTLSMKKDLDERINEISYENRHKSVTETIRRVLTWWVMKRESIINQIYSLEKKYPEIVNNEDLKLELAIIRRKLGDIRDEEI